MTSNPGPNFSRVKAFAAFSKLLSQNVNAFKRYRNMRDAVSDKAFLPSDASNYFNERADLERSCGMVIGVSQSEKAEAQARYHALDQIQEIAQFVYWHLRKKTMNGFDGSIESYVAQFRDIVINHIEKQRQALVAQYGKDLFVLGQDEYRTLGP